MPGNLPPAGSVAFPSSQHPRSGLLTNGVFPQEPSRRFLEVWKEIHFNQGKVSSDEGCPLYSGDNSQLTAFATLNCVDSMSHFSGLYLVTSATTPDSGSPCIRNYGLTASECRLGSYYYQGSGKGQFRSQ